MSLFIDPRAGSGPLLAPLRRIITPSSIVQHEPLEFGDVMWNGYGPERGKAYGYAAEIKRVSDVLDSRNSGRLAGHQLRGMLDTYDFVWVVVIDDFRPEPSTGILQRVLPKDKRTKGREVFSKYSNARYGRRKQEMYSAFISYLTTIQLYTRCNVWPVRDETELAWWIASTYWHSQKKEHKSLDVFNTSINNRLPILFKPNKVACVAKEAPGVGWDRALKIGERFDSPREMVNASVEEYEQMRIGKKVAKGIVEFWNEPVAGRRKK